VPTSSSPWRPAPAWRWAGRQRRGKILAGAGPGSASWPAQPGPWCASTMAPPSSNALSMIRRHLGYLPQDVGGASSMAASPRTIARLDRKLRRRTCARSGPGSPGRPMRIFLLLPEVLISTRPSAKRHFPRSAGHLSRIGLVLPARCSVIPFPGSVSSRAQCQSSMRGEIALETAAVKKKNQTPSGPRAASWIVGGSHSTSSLVVP